MGTWKVAKRLRMRTAKLSRNINKVAKSNTSHNYWYPLTCLDEEQEPRKAKIEPKPKSESKQELKLHQTDQVLNITEQEGRQIRATYAAEVDDLEQEMERLLAEFENKMADFNDDERLKALEQVAAKEEVEQAAEGM